MLSDPQTIDIVIPIQSDALMLVISDMHPWPDADSNQRLGQYMEKLQAYCRYVADDGFGTKHPGVSRAKIVISLVTLVPASARMRHTRVVNCQKLGSTFSIPVSYADETTENEASPTVNATVSATAGTRSHSKKRFFDRGLIVAVIGGLPMFTAWYYSTQFASRPELRSPFADKVMGVCFWVGALLLTVGLGMIIWSQKKAQSA